MKIIDRVKERLGLQVTLPPDVDDVLTSEVDDRSLIGAYDNEAVRANPFDPSLFKYIHEPEEVEIDANN